MVDVAVGAAAADRIITGAVAAAALLLVVAHGISVRTYRLAHPPPTIDGSDIIIRSSNQYRIRYGMGYDLLVR